MKGHFAQDSPASLRAGLAFKHPDGPSTPLPTALPNLTYFSETTEEEPVPSLTHPHHPPPPPHPPRPRLNNESRLPDSALCSTIPTGEESEIKPKARR